MLPVMPLWLKLWLQALFELLKQSGIPAQVAFGMAAGIVVGIWLCFKLATESDNRQ
jgi:hypothetical protein